MISLLGVPLVIAAPNLLGDGTFFSVYGTEPPMPQSQEIRLREIVSLGTIVSQQGLRQLRHRRHR